MFKLIINNSYCRFEGSLPREASELITALLSYEIDISQELSNLWYRTKYLKRQIDELKHNTDKESRELYLKYNKSYFGNLDSIKKLEATKNVCWFTDNSFPTGHLNLVREALKPYQYETVDVRTIPLQDHFFKWVHRPPEPRYFQEEIHQKCLKDHRGVIVSCVGSGKTLMQIRLTKELGVNTLVIVPSSNLGVQLYDEFSWYLGRHNVEQVTTQQVRSGKKLKPIRIITIQSLASLYESGDLPALISDVKMLLADEFHHAGSDSYLKLIESLDHIYYRFGYTGTFLRNDHKTLDMWGFLSNVLYRYPAHQAIKDGFLTPIRYIIHDLPGKRKMNYQKEYDLNYCGNPNILNRVSEICKVASLDKQILILINKKDKAGAIFYEKLKMEGHNVAYVSGDNSKDEVAKAIKDFNDRKIKILIGSTILGEGIDIRSTEHLILAQGGKSEIVMVQAIGRLVRLFEGKQEGFLHDFNFSNTKFMQKHFEIRKEIIRNNFEPISEMHL